MTTNLFGRGREERGNSVGTEKENIERRWWWRWWAIAREKDCSSLSPKESIEHSSRFRSIPSPFFSLSPLVVSREKTFFPRELVYLQLPLLVNSHSFFRGNYVIQYGFKYGITGTLREPIIASPSLQALRDSGTQFREQHPLLLVTRSPRYCIREYTRR